jgi:Zn-dependent protease with chaperone function
MTVSELLFVIGHEVGHVMKDHVRKEDTACLCRSGGPQGCCIH